MRGRGFPASLFRLARAVEEGGACRRALVLGSRSADCGGRPLIHPRRYLQTLPHVSAAAAAAGFSRRWAAAAGHLEPGAGVLAALLYFWQLPHFMALAYLYRADYAAGGCGPGRGQAARLGLSLLLRALLRGGAQLIAAE